ncbi:complement C1q tumor necrosis factor-related protein 1-like [Glandiceps talaboti]
MKGITTAVFILTTYLISLTSTQESPCVQCCDYQPTTTPGVFSVIRGEKGDSGEAGQNGRSGKAGPKGEMGPPGLVGPKGMAGNHGTPGEIGFPGIKGAKGEPSNINQWDAFSVATNKKTRGSNTYKTVTYTHTFVNTADNMNLSEGVFTCQIPGMYFITFTTLNDEDKTIGAYIMQNNQPKVRMNAAQGKSRGMQSQSVILQLQQNDRVWVRVDASPNVSLHSDRKLQTTFSGYLIHPTL